MLLLRDIVSSFERATGDHSLDTGRWYLEGVVMGADVGPLKKGDVVARVSVVISPLGGRSVALFFRAPRDVESDEVTCTIPVQIALTSIPGG